MESATATLPLLQVLRTLDTAMAGLTVNSDKILSGFCAGLVKDCGVQKDSMQQALDQFRGVRCTLCKNDKVVDTLSQCLWCKKTVHTQCLNKGFCWKICKQNFEASK